MVKTNDEIVHPVVRATLNFMNIKDGLEIHHDGDLPAKTGLGSSSAFTVGMLHTLYALQGIMPTKKRLANEAIHIERDILQEHVGSQDQVLAAVGGFNKIEFLADHDFLQTPIIIGVERLQELQSHLMLFYTGISRYASRIAQKKIENIPNRKKELTVMRQMVDEALEILTNKSPMTEFGKLLHESWRLKKSLSDSVSTPHVDEMYDAAISAGATGGKLLGAGGGGFMLVFAPPANQPAIMKRLKDYFCIPFKFDEQGSQIVVYQPSVTSQHI